MTPAAFRYARPSSVSEAAALLAGTPDARLLAGGQSLVPLMTQRLARPSLVIDINRLPGLREVRREGDWISIGALVRLETARCDPLVRRHVPLLADALRWVANPGIRQRGTVAGNLAHNGPGTELAAVALVLGAKLAVTGGAAETELVDAATALARPGPLSGFIRHVLWPVAAPESAGAFHEIARRPGHVGLVGAAVHIAGTTPRVALSGLCATPLACPAVAELLGRAGTAHPAGIAAALARDVGDTPLLSDALAPGSGRLALAPGVIATAARAVAGIHA